MSDLIFMPLNGTFSTGGACPLNYSWFCRMIGPLLKRGFMGALIGTVLKVYKSIEEHRPCLLLIFWDDKLVPSHGKVASII